MHQHIARLCVLFEDLRIEIAGIAARHIDQLDSAGDQLRAIYSNDDLSALSLSLLKLFAS
jgi:hypothetical protein